MDVFFGLAVPFFVNAAGSGFTESGAGRFLPMIGGGGAIGSIDGAVTSWVETSGSSGLIWGSTGSEGGEGADKGGKSLLASCVVSSCSSPSTVSSLPGSASSSRFSFGLWDFEGRSGGGGGPRAMISSNDSRGSPVVGSTMISRLRKGSHDLML